MPAGGSPLISAIRRWLAACVASCAVLLSPWTDLTLSGASMTEKVGIDPSFVPEKVQIRANDYVASADPANPAISPLFADLRGLPPTLIQAGSNEILLDDSARLAARAASDDVAVILDVTPGGAPPVSVVRRHGGGG